MCSWDLLILVLLFFVFFLRHGPLPSCIGIDCVYELRRWDLSGLDGIQCGMR